MTDLHAVPCTDGTRRRAFAVLREAGVRDHHDVLPWDGITSLSVESGVSEGAVRGLIRWIRAGRPPFEVTRSCWWIRIDTYLPDGDVEIRFDVASHHEETRMPDAPAPEPINRPPPGRVRLGAPRPIAPEPAPAVIESVPVLPEPEPVVLVPPAPAPVVRPHVGRYRLGPRPPVPVAEPVAIVPEPEPVVPTPVLVTAPVAVPRAGRVRWGAPRLPVPVVEPEPEPVVVAKPVAPAPEVRRPPAVSPRRGLQISRRLAAPPTYGPPCPAWLHPDLADSAIPFK